MVVGGAAVGVVGVAALISTLVLRYTGNPERLEKLENERGVLPTDSAKRRSIIRSGVALPYLLGGGAALTAAGALIAFVGTRRIKKLRARKKDSLTWSVGPSLAGIGGRMEVRF